MGFFAEIPLAAPGVCSNPNAESNRLICYKRLLQMCQGGFDQGFDLEWFSWFGDESLPLQRRVDQAERGWAVLRRFLGDIAGIQLARFAAVP